MPPMGSSGRADGQATGGSSNGVTRTSISNTVRSTVSDTRIHGMRFNAGVIGRAGGVAVAAPARPPSRTRTLQYEEGNPPPPAPLTLLTGTPSITPGCGACAETVRARLDEPTLLKEKRHAAGVFVEADEDSEDSDEDDPARVPNSRATEKAAEKAAARAFWQHHYHAAGGGAGGGEIGAAGGLNSGDGQRHRAIWKQRGPKTSSVGLIICLNIGEGHGRFV